MYFRLNNPDELLQRLYSRTKSTTYREIAEVCGGNEKSIRNAFRGERVGRETVAAIAGCLGVEVSTIATIQKDGK